MLTRRTTQPPANLAGFWSDLSTLGQDIGTVVVGAAGEELDKQLFEVKATLGTIATMSLISAICGVYLVVQDWRDRR